MLEYLVQLNHLRLRNNHYHAPINNKKIYPILFHSSSIYSVKSVFLKIKLRGWFNNYDGIMDLTKVSNILALLLSWNLGPLFQ